MKTPTNPADLSAHIYYAYKQIDLSMRSYRNNFVRNASTLFLGRLRCVDESNWSAWGPCMNMMECLWHRQIARIVFVHTQEASKQGSIPSPSHRIHRIHPAKSREKLGTANTSFLVSWPWPQTASPCCSVDLMHKTCICFSHGRPRKRRFLPILPMNVHLPSSFCWEFLRERQRERPQAQGGRQRGAGLEFESLLLPIVRSFVPSRWCTADRVTPRSARICASLQSAAGSLPRISTVMYLPSSLPLFLFPFWLFARTYVCRYGCTCVLVHTN
jgi:hypothetical protein